MKKSIAFILLFLLILLVPFIWGENLSVHKQINAEKFSAYSTLIAAIFTSITVYLLYTQNKQQLDDRKAVSQPDLYPSQLNLYTQDNSMPDSGGKIEYYPTFSKRKKEDFFVIDPGSARVQFQLYNIGLGPAKEITLSWIYDKDAISKLLEGVYDVKHYELNETEFDFIPANDNIVAEFPEHYMKSMGYKVNRSRPLFRPKLLLKISFLDVYNNTFSKGFDVNFEVVSNYISIRFKQVKSN